MPGYELIGSEESDNIQEVFDNGGVLFRHGFESMRNNVFMVRDFETEFAGAMGSRHALAVSSGTAALRVALAALGIGPGDEVITQSFTFVATVEAIVESGAVPRCANIDKTLNIDVGDLERIVSPQTKAIIAVHMLGVPANLEALLPFCLERGIHLIEDTAWGLGGNLRGKPLGTWGVIGTYSFDHAKAMTTGEGGMIVTDDTGVYNRAMAWHDHGHENQPGLPRWKDARSAEGFNYRMSELQGAVGRAQLKKLTQVVDRQRENFQSVLRVLVRFPSISLREEVEGANSTYDAIVFSLGSAKLASDCREALVSEGLGTKILPEAISWHFAGDWGHIRSLVEAHGGNLGLDLVNSRKILERCVALPLPVFMESDYLIRLAKALSKVLSEKK